MRKWVKAVSKASGLEIDDKHYEKAFEEFAQRQPETIAFARAIAAANGDNEKVRALYIQIRARRLQQSQECKALPEDDRHYAQAFSEISTNNPNKASYARSVAASNGNDDKLKSIYIKKRVTRLIDEENECLSEVRRQEKEAEEAYLRAQEEATRKQEEAYFRSQLTEFQRETLDLLEFSKKYKNCDKLPRDLQLYFLNKSNLGENFTEELYQAIDEQLWRNHRNILLFLCIITPCVIALCIFGG